MTARRESGNRIRGRLLVGLGLLTLLGLIFFSPAGLDALPGASAGLAIGAGWGILRMTRR